MITGSIIWEIIAQILLYLTNTGGTNETKTINNYSKQFKKKSLLDRSLLAVHEESSKITTT